MSMYMWISISIQIQVYTGILAQGTQKVDELDRGDVHWADVKDPFGLWASGSYF